MTPQERYRQVYELTDPEDPLVKDEISKGIRWQYGETDIHVHLPLLKSIARGNVLEIGVRFGASTAALLAGVEENGGYVWSVDTEPCEFAYGLFRDHARWQFIQMDSKSYYLRDFVPRELELLLIDGDHSYEGVLADLTNFGPRAKVVALHDISPTYHSSGTPEVLRAIGAYLKSRPRQRQMVVYPGSNRMAVLI